MKTRFKEYNLKEEEIEKEYKFESWIILIVFCIVYFVVGIVLKNSEAIEE